MIAAHAGRFAVCVRHRIRLTGSSATFYFVFDSYFVFRLMFAVRWCRLRQFSRPSLFPIGRRILPEVFAPRTAIEMSERRILRLGSFKEVAQFQEHLRSLQIEIPCDSEIVHAAESPLRKPLVGGEIKIGNRIAVQPMEGWDGTADGNPSEHSVRRWKRFGLSGAKLIWGGEAVAVSHAGRANPNQLVIAEHTREGLAKLRAVLIEEHRRTAGSDQGLLIGLQLTHSGRYCRPNSHDRPEPRILYHHPILGRKLGLPDDHPLLTDGEIEAV